MSWKTTLILLPVVLLYIVLAGVGFHYLESATEKTIRADLNSLIQRFIESNPCVNSTKLLNLLRRVAAARDDGIVLTALDNSTANSSTTSWDLHSSIFFATTVVSTIGYGNVAPQTVGGRVLAVLAAFFGIPLFLILLSMIGAYQSKLCDWLILNRVFRPATATAVEQEEGFTSDARRQREIGSGEAQRTETETTRAGSGKGTDGEESEMDKGPGIKRVEAGTACRCVAFHLVRILVSLVFCVTFFCLIPAVIFQAVEDWSYGESIYYSVITIMTIGFGDYVAGASTQVSYRVWYRLGVSVWIILGLASCAGFLTTLQDAYSALIEVFQRKAAEKRAAARMAAAREQNVVYRAQSVSGSGPSVEADGKKVENGGKRCKGDTEEITTQMQ